MAPQGKSLCSRLFHLTQPQELMLPLDDNKKRPAALNLTSKRSASTDSSSSTSSLKPPRTPRFAEATSVHSPVDGPRSPFVPMDDKSEVPQSQPGDIGFGYINNRESSAVPMSPKTPLKSAMKVPGTPARRFDNPLSPTFREEDILEKKESKTAKDQVRDLVRGNPVMAGWTLPDYCERLTRIAEDQSPGAHGQVCPSRRQLQLCLDHYFHALSLLRHFQCNEGFARA